MTTGRNCRSLSFDRSAGVVMAVTVAGVGVGIGIGAGAAVAAVVATPALTLTLTSVGCCGGGERVIIIDRLRTNSSISAPSNITTFRSLTTTTDAPAIAGLCV